MKLRSVISVLLALLVGVFSTSAVAQTNLLVPQGEAVEAPIAELNSPEAVREMVSRLSDNEVRNLLLQHLDAVAESDVRNNAESGFLAFIKTSAIGFVAAVIEPIERLPMLWEKRSEAFKNFAADRGAGGVIYFFGVLILAIVCGLVAEWIIDRFASSWRNRIAQTTSPENLRGALSVLGLRLFLDIIGLIAFFVVTRIVLQYTVTDADEALVRLIMLEMVVYPRLMAALLRFLFAPKRPDLRLVHTDDDSARFLFRHLVGLVLFMGLNTAVINFGEINGVPMGETRLGFWLNILAHIYIGWIAWKARDGLRKMLLGWEDEVTPTEAKVAHAYPWYIIGVSVMMWIIVEILVSMDRFDLIGAGQHNIIMILLIFAPASETLIRGLVKHLVPPMTGEGELAARAYLSTKRSYIRIGRVIVFFVVVLSIADIWNIEFENLASSGFGARVAAGLIELLMILGSGYLVWELVTLWINRKLAAEQTAAGVDLNAEEPGGGEGGGAGGSRLSTVLPLIRWFLQAGIIVMTVLVGFGNVGVDVTPLLAGAGIVGLAIGFGAQKLVADVVSGIFFLIDDAFRAGEFVDIEGTVGTVEKISMRSMQLRHHRGPVHTIPYGEIPKITNYSRDWVIMKLRFTVPFETDLTKVKKIFKNIGADMMAVPEFADDFLQPFKSQGVLEVDDVGIVVRGKFMAKPGKQFTLRKEIYQRVQKAFDENGLQFARKEVRVKIDNTDKYDLSEEDKQTIAGAASDSAEKPKLSTEQSGIDNI